MKELPKWPHHIGFKFVLMLTAGIRRLPGVSRGHGRTRAGPGQAAGRQGAASQLLVTAVWPGSWWHCSNSCQDGGSLQNSKNFHCFSFCSCSTFLSTSDAHNTVYCTCSSVIPQCQNQLSGSVTKCSYFCFITCFVAPGLNNGHQIKSYDWFNCCLLDIKIVH